MQCYSKDGSFDEGKLNEFLEVFDQNHKKNSFLLSILVRNLLEIEPSK